MFNINNVDASNKEKIRNILIENWGSDQMVTRGKVYNVLEHEGYVVKDETDEVLGILMFRIEDRECEILSLDSFKERIGIGTTLLNYWVL